MCESIPNPHISAESWHINTIKRSYFIVTLSRFIFRSQIYFLFSSSSLQLLWWRHDNITSTSFKLMLKIKEASYDESWISWLHSTRSRWATRALELNPRFKKKTLDPQESTHHLAIIWALESCSGIPRRTLVIWYEMMQQVQRANAVYEIKQRAQKSARRTTVINDLRCRSVFSEPTPHFFPMLWDAGTWTSSESPQYRTMISHAATQCNYVRCCDNHRELTPCPRALM
jgi:hypothetical protein